jgi:hypothetical protein
VTKLEFEIWSAARHMATDDEIARMFALNDQQLARYRRTIDGARTDAMIRLRYARAEATAKRGASKPGERPRP